MDGFRNRWFADAALRGVYPDDMVADYEGRWGPLSFVRDGDLARIAAPIDFLGVNYYSPTRVRANARSAFFELDALPPRGPATSMGWEVEPDGLYELLLRLKEDYGDLPLVITENGASYDDAPPVDGVVDDPARLAYLRGHVDAVRRALAAGVDVRGYFVWSLLDNFEWAEGYTRRFGIVYVDFETQRRVPKRSGLWYRDLIAGNGSY